MRRAVLNTIDRSSGLASVRYGPNELEVVREGRFVRCAVTQALIPLEELRYWNVQLQEAYASPEIALQRWRELQQGGR